MEKAGSKASFREVDYVLPLLFATAAKASETSTFALVTAIGAAADSSFFYPRTKGELERDVQAIGFSSLTIVRPSMIGGQREDHRAGESFVLHLSKALSPILPRKYRISPASNIAAALIEAVVLGPPGCNFRFSESLL
jgi:uncharacterized protein YbjT (DUF2867 family)